MRIMLVAIVVGLAACQSPGDSDGPVPTLAERQMLGEWLACGAL